MLYKPYYCARRTTDLLSIAYFYVHLSSAFLQNENFSHCSDVFAVFLTIPIWGLWLNQVEFKISFYHELERVYTLAEAEEALNNDPNFLLQFDDNECSVIDVVELPSDNMDIISDEEDIDEALLGESVPKGYLW